MTAINNALAAAEVATVLLPVLSRTTSSQGSGLNIRKYDGEAMLLFYAGAATAGTNPTLDFTLEESEDDGATDAYAAVPATAYVEETNPTQVTTVASLQLRRFKNISDRKAFVRPKWVLGGTSTPTFPLGAAIVAQKQYR